MEVVLDTHTLIWFLTADKKLGKKAKKTIDNIGSKQDRLIISVVVLMEVLVLIEKKKVKFTWEEFSRKISEFPHTLVYPIGIDVIGVMQKVGTNLELHDRIIVATAILHDAVILSKDPEIASIKEVKTIW